MLQGSWRTKLQAEFEKIYMKDLNSFLKSEIKKGKKIYPKDTECYSAFNLSPFEIVKVVILGQDPYHGPGQAHGLSFSVPEGVRPPPSLVNIFKELENDLARKMPKDGCLESWAKQGVLLLNSVLTVEAEQAASHKKKGWEIFTDEVIKMLNDEKENLVFILWGSYAQKKAEFVDVSRHLVIKSAHPSPLSSYRGFFGSKPFSQTNDYLIKKGLKPIEW